MPSRFDRAKARALSNPDLAPHLKFVDIGGHGYATVRLTGDEMRTEFVCIPPPITRSRHARRRAAALSHRPHRASCGRRASGRSWCSKSWRAIPASPSRRMTAVNGWYWQALSVATALACGPADRDRARLEARATEARDARRRRAHLHHARASAAGSPGCSALMGQPFVGGAIVAGMRRDDGRSAYSPAS